jgi:hypothetical protein
VFNCPAGEVHGAIERLYDDVLAFETTLGVYFDYVLQVGGFGICPDRGNPRVYENSRSL